MNGYRKSRIDVAFYVSLFENVLRDAHASFPEIPSREFERDMCHVRERVQFEGLPFLTVMLPSLGKAVDQALERGELIVPPGFARKSKQGVRWNIPNLFSALFLVSFTTEGVLRPDGSGAVGMIRQLCYLCYKVPVPFTPEQLEAACIRFRATDTSLAPISKEMRARPAFKYARLVLARLLRDFDPGTIKPRHGPGAVAEKLPARAKYSYSHYSREIDQLYPYYTHITYGVLAQDLESKIAHCGLQGGLPPSRVCFVPKDSRGPRVIAAEPAILQFLQQGLGRSLVKWTEHHPLTKGRVLFTDQSKHRGLALRSSINRRFATLDLKDASDRVSNELVEALFPEKLVPYLKALRSPCAQLPDGSRVQLRKYASMGSALCFPIEALTFFSLALGALRSVSRRRRAHSRAYVYGDDIIVPTAGAPAVIAELELYGVQFSKAKCFINGYFRESCGIDAYMGEDVTPVKIRTLVLDDPRQRRANLVSLNCNANALFDHGYWHAARFLDEYVEKWWGVIPTTVRTFNGLSRRSSVLPMRTVIPRGVRFRKNRALDVLEVWTLRLKARKQASHFPSDVSRLGHNLSLGVAEPYAEEVAVPHSALTKAVWASTS